ncbi:MAG: hypothetical protein V4568_15810 [Pseudomonadota bacterium]
MNSDEEEDLSSVDLSSDEEVSPRSPPSPVASTSVTNEETGDEEGPQFVVLKKRPPLPRQTKKTFRKEKGGRVPVKRAYATEEEKIKSESRRSQPLGKDPALPNSKTLMLPTNRFESSKIGGQQTLTTEMWPTIRGTDWRLLQSKRQLLTSIRRELDNLRTQKKQLQRLKDIANDFPEYQEHFSFQRSISERYLKIKGYVSELSMTDAVKGDKLKEISDYISTYLLQSKEQKTKVDAIERSMGVWLDTHWHANLERVDDNLDHLQDLIDRRFQCPSATRPILVAQ